MSRYTVYITPSALHEVRNLPGHVRQRVKRAISQLAENPHPPDSKELDLPDLAVSLWRLRLDQWRILYAITDAERVVDVLAIRKRPPFDYGDLDELLADV